MIVVTASKRQGNWTLAASGKMAHSGCVIGVIAISAIRLADHEEERLGSPRAERRPRDAERGQSRHDRADPLHDAQLEAHAVVRPRN